jgi:hypothetical protein
MVPASDDAGSKRGKMGKMKDGRGKTETQEDAVSS